ncbi:MAG: 2-amino-4-hydroxy-6-hydroxymethyldihydropteridine diphosphokinase [Muribaculaceae bacterium]|nr:2-amino-4-hydroxy-6-hydroxymethyldihydropteridine diphosphokinase [Muribaculaceae bacterium]
MKSRAIICMGANGADAEVQIARALDVVQNLGEIAVATPPYRSEAEFARDAAPYLNQIVILDSVLALDSVQSLTKDYQTRCRAEADIAPLVAIDIDIVAWNGTVLRPADMASRYFRKGWAMLHHGAQEFGELLPDTLLAEFS